MAEELRPVERGRCEIMTTPVVKKVWLKVRSNITVDEVSGLIADALGWRGEILRGETVVIHASGADEDSRRLIMRVRSFSPPNSSTATESFWTSQGDGFVSPLLRHGDDLRIEVDTSASGVNSVPTGGGYFRIVEEGGGGG